MKMTNEELVNLTLFQAKIIPYFVADDERNKAELLKRLDDGETAKMGLEAVLRENERLRGEINIKETVELQALNTADNLRCCGNCKATNKECPNGREFEYNKQYYCDNWQSDGMKREDRII